MQYGKRTKDGGATAVSSFVVGLMTWCVVMGLSFSVGAQPESEADEEVELDEIDPGSSVADDLGVDEAPAVAERLAQRLVTGLEDEFETSRRRLTLALGGNVAGNFARVDCRQDAGYSDLYWARYAAYLEALNEEAQQTDLVEPVALNTGNSLFPGALGRYLMDRREEGGPAKLADILASVDLEVHGIGSREFATPRPAFVDFLEAMGEHDIGMQAANLECEAYEGAEAICGSAVTAGDERPYRIVERQGVKLAITTVLDEQAFDNISRFQHDDVRILKPEEVLPGLVDEMQSEADLVIVQYQSPSRIASQRTYDVASQVSGIDLMVASNLIDSPFEAGPFDAKRPALGGRMAVIEAAATGTPIVSANSGHHTGINVELDTVARDLDEPRWVVRRAIPRRVELDELPDEPSTRDELTSAIDNFCNDWGDPIGEHATLVEPFEIGDLQQFVLNVMRFSTRTEVALYNTGAFRNQEQFPLTGQLTRSDIYTALPFENRLVTVDIKGSVLAGLAGRLGDDVVGAGIEVVDGSVRINGRPVSPDRTYQVALNDYLAEGGDGVFSAGDFSRASYHHPDFSDDPPSVGDIVIDYVERGRHLTDGRVRDAVSAQDNFPSLHHKWLWGLTGSLNAAYNQVAVDNPEGGYTQNQLTVQSTDQINIEGRLAANADSRNHGWNNSLDVQYAATRIDDEDAEGFERTRDRIRLRSRYRYKRLRADLGGRWFVPDPVVEGQAETEFSSPDDRDWHRLDLRAIAGASFQLLDPLDVRLGVNVNQDVREPDGRATWGVNASYTLARISPLRILERPIRLESEVEYFYNDIGRNNIHETRSANRVFFAIFDEFFFTTTFNAFLYRDDNVGELGTNTELTVGVNYEWERAFQNF